MALEGAVTERTKEIKLQEGDEKLGIYKIQDKGTYVVVYTDKTAARQNSKEFDERLRQLNVEIERELSRRDPNASKDLVKEYGADRYFENYTAFEKVIENFANLPTAGGTVRTKYANYVMVDPDQTLSKFFNSHAKAENVENSPGVKLEKTLSPEQRDAFLNYVRLHEQGHATRTGPETFMTEIYEDEGNNIKYLMVDAKNMGLDEAGADFYAAAMSLKQNPQARAVMEIVGDAEVLKFLRNDVTAEDKSIEHYNFGSYFAISMALEMSPDELKNMSEEDIVKMASQYDSFSEREALVEVSVKNDVYREMEALGRETGRTPSLKEAVDSLSRKNIYAENGTLTGEDNAIKFMTLERMKQALDRLEQKGIELSGDIFKPPALQSPSNSSGVKPLVPG